MSEWSELDMVPAGKVMQKRSISEKVSIKIQHPSIILDSAILHPAPCSLASIHFSKLVSSPPAVCPASSKDSKTIKLSQAYSQPLDPCPAPVTIWVTGYQYITHKPLQWSSRVGHRTGGSQTGAKRVSFQAPGKPEASPSTDGELDMDKDGQWMHRGATCFWRKSQRSSNLRQRGASPQDVLVPDYMADTKV